MTTTTQCQAETRFVALMTELFQMDEAQALDFGIYRIIRRQLSEQLAGCLGFLLGISGQTEHRAGLDR